ncbi:MAG: RICIN domain-containing protein [Pirellulaceae bacterium]|nr:RICIN domain-containing protein [Pirellulaceae bacterium]
MKKIPTRTNGIRLLTTCAGMILAAAITVQAAPASGRYRLQNRASGMVLNNNGSTTDGTTVSQWPSDPSNNLKWNLSTVGSYWKLQCVTGGRYLDSLNNSANDTPVGQWSGNASNNQQWTLQDLGGGYWRIVNRTNGKALDTGGGTGAGAVMEFWTVGGSYNQQWQFIPDPAGFIHPGVTHNNADFDRMKAIVNADPAKTAYERFRVGKHTDRFYFPRPKVNVTYGQGQFEIRDDSLAAYFTAIMWWMTGDPVYRDKSKQIINAWVTTMQTFDVTDHLSAAAAVHNFANAGEILRYKNGGFTAAEITAFENMLTSKLLPPLLTPGGSIAADWLEGGNHGSTQIYGLMAMGVFCNRQDIYDFAVRSFNKNSGGTSYGVQQYIHPSGQNYESYRDQGHAVGGWGCYAPTAEIAWKQGLDLYAVGGNRIFAGSEHVASFNMMWDVVPVSWTAQDGIGRSSVTTLARTPRVNWSFMHAYNHYKTRRGLAMPYTKLMIDFLSPWDTSFMYMEENPGVLPPRPADFGEPAPTAVALFGDGEYGGNFLAKFGVGSFNNAALLAAGGRENGASSAKVPRGWKVTLFDGGNFDGASVVLTGNENFLGDLGMNDRVSSLRVENTGGNVDIDVTFYDGADFTGTSVKRGPGYYDTAQMGIANDTISSIRIPAGYIVMTWDGSGFGYPPNWILQADTPNMGTGATSSFLVMKKF